MGPIAFTNLYFCSLLLLHSIATTIIQQDFGKERIKEKNNYNLLYWKKIKYIYFQR